MSEATVREKVNLVQQKLNQLRSEKDVNTEVYAANLSKYLTNEAKNLQNISSQGEYTDEKEKKIQVNRVRKRILIGKKELEKLGVDVKTLVDASTKGPKAPPKEEESSKGSSDESDSDDYSSEGEESESGSQETESFEIVARDMPGSFVANRQSRQSNDPNRSSNSEYSDDSENSENSSVSSLNLHYFTYP